MTEIKEFLKQMISEAGPSGYEDPVRKVIEKEWQPLVDKMQVSKVGSLEGLKEGTGKAPRKSILLAGHQDAIGLITVRVVDGFIYFTQIGGVDPRVLPGQPVIVHGKEPLQGVVMQPSELLLNNHRPGAPVPMEHLVIDVGLSPAKVAKLVNPGDIISFAQMPFDLSGETVAGHTMDDRAAVAAITVCLQELQSRIHSWDVWAVATVQEETAFLGAYTSGFGLKPDLSVAIDVTHAKGPGTSESDISNLGKGMVLGYGPNINTKWYKFFKKVADDLEIPYQNDWLPSHSGTDGYALQVINGGRPNMVFSIPLRYMHTPVEVVSMKDIKRTGRLLAEVITRLDDNFMDTLGWED